jgi:RNA polymerase sigma-70 factor (ECF subfamily)
MRHKDRLHTYTAWVLRDMEGARDVTQQSLIRLWERRASVAEEAAGTWLRRTAHRLCVDRMRKRGAQQCSTLDALTAPPTNGHGGLEAAELRRTVSEALSRLGPRDRAVLVLREMDGLTYDQMCDVTGLSLGTLKATLHRARERLRRAIAGEEVMK